MERVSLTVHRLDERNKFSEGISTLTTAIDGTAGAEFLMNERDDKYLVLVQNAATSEKTVTIKHGNGIQGVCDLEDKIPASGYKFVQLESGRFKNVSGEDKGKVIITGDANIKAAVFKLP